jgi:hypothetical protein
LNHIHEEDLIAYQLHEAVDASAIRAHLETCPDCANTAESIAETLRVFSAEPVPLANLDHAWQRLRGSMPPAAVAPRRRVPVWSWLAAPLLAGALLLAYVAAHHHPAPQDHTPVAHLKPGPFTDQPRDPDLASHLESAERFLTEVSHSAGPLDETTRHQAQTLLLSNALYVRKANADGDLAEAAVLDQLDRTLTTLQHEPTHPDKTESGWHLRVAMDTNGLLLDIRILQQNDSTSKESQ